MSSSIQQLLEGKIDFEGQKSVERITHYAFAVLTAVSFVLGFTLQSLSVTFGIFGLGVALLLVAVIPPWPPYNKHPVQWLPARETKKE
ncbi:microsomal signal peptidase subunit, partial [Auriscalpium vulgare]